MKVTPLLMITALLTFASIPASTAPTLDGEQLSLCSSAGGGSITEPKHGEDKHKHGEVKLSIAAARPKPDKQYK